MGIVLERSVRPEDRDAIRAGLRIYNMSNCGFRGGFEEISILLRDPDTGATEGGLTAATFYGWMFVELLFVPEHRRGQGLGTEIMRRAEQHAREIGLVGVWVDTFSFQARPFYEKLGYRLFGEIADYPPGGSRYFLSKVLSPEPRTP